jgi:hypothetical protein
MTTENTTIQQFKMDDGQVHQFRMPNGLSVSEMTRLATDSYNQAKEQEFSQAQESNVLETKPRSTLGILGQSAIKGVAGLGDLPTGFVPNVKELYRYATTPNAELHKFRQPVTEALIHQGILKAENEPNTPALKGMDFITQLGTGGGINPFTIAKNTLPQLGRFAAQGLAGTATQQVLESSNINPLGQAIGTALTMGAVGTPSALRSTVGDVARNSLKNVTPEQMKLADLLMKDAQRLGSPLTAAEALAQVTGGNRLTSTQRIVENSPKSSQTMADFMNQRPSGNVNAFNQTVNEISPFSTTPLALNQAATNFIERSEKGLTKRVNPLYKQATVEIMPLQSEIKNLRSNPAIDDAINHVINDKYAGAYKLNPESPEALIAAKKYADAQYVKFSNNMTESYDKTKAANAYAASRQLDNYLKSKSPSYLQGSNAYEQTQTNFIQPRKEGMLGQLAETSGTSEGMMGQQRGILMPSAPKATSPKEISATIKLLRREDPNVVQNWTRQNLKSIFDENSQNLQSGANQFGGAKFSADIVGNANQKANLRTLVSESASPEAWKGFETMLDVFQAQGKRLPAGSATAFNQAELETLKGGGVGKIPLLPTNLSKAMDVYEQFRLGKNTKKLADLLTDPEGLQKLEELSKTKPNTAKREVLTNSLAGGVIAGKSPINLTVTKEE